jgi:hypothetical protein
MPPSQGPNSVRELYLKSFPPINLQQHIMPPFYTIHYIFHLYYIIWGQKILEIFNEDQRVGGISDISFNGAEDIRKTFSLVQCGGSLAWRGSDMSSIAEIREPLEEDFKHLLHLADRLVETLERVTREKMTSVNRQRADARRSVLTIAFTFV